MSRGKKKPSLQSLSRESLLPEDYPALHSELITSSDRAATIIACGMVESALLSAIAARLILGERKFELLFFGQDAPLRSFSAKIKIGRALGIYAGNLHGMLDRIRRVRNVFAHSIRPLSLTHELVEKELNKLPAATLSKVKLAGLQLDLSRLTPHRERYLAVCFNVAIVLEDHAKRFRGQPKIIDLVDGGPPQPRPLPRKSSKPHPPDNRNPD